MPLRKKLRSAFFGRSKDNDRQADNVIPAISVPAPSTSRPNLSQQDSLRPQTLKEHSRRCHYCDNIVILPYVMHQGHKRYIPYKHHPSFRDLLDAADQGCDICMIFRDRLISLGVSQGWSKASVLLFTDEQLEWISGSISTNEYSETTHLTVKLVTEPIEGKRTCLAAVKFGLFEQQGTILLEKFDGEWTLTATLVNPSKTCVVGRPIASDPRLSQCMGLLNSWLRECLINHLPCQRNTTDFFPTRIIDVGPTDASREPRLRLTKGQGLKGPYVALSHCWGETRSLTTITENISHRLESRPMSSMPANFRDAVWVTRRLSLRYLWIDSLCIIQNSKADWELEAESMGEIYGNSFLTIAAAKAKNSSEGFLQPRPESVTKTLAALFCSSGDGA